MVDFELSIKIQGTNDQDYISRSMEALGELIVEEVRKNIRKMDLISEGKGAGMLLQHWVSSYSGGVLHIESTEEYSIYIEFGTYGYWNKYGLDGFPATTDPKKKDMRSAGIIEELIKKFPKGMQPFSPVRKVIYNPKMMQRLITKAFNSQL